MVGGILSVLFIAVLLWLAHRRASLWTFAIAFTVLLLLYDVAGSPAPVWKGILWLLLIGFWLLGVRPLRAALISGRFMRTYRRLLPAMSDTEREALEAGTVWWDGELFTGRPDWRKLAAAAPPALSAEEQAFLDGPCETLCAMLDDFDITHRRGDLPPPVWDYLKSQRFFAMIIPRRYGGLEFSTFAHSCVLTKIASRSITCASTVAVPNSLGPAELLVHYGTEQQKNHYLPRLARAEEIPCFALTGPRVGSDAAAIPDSGVVCRGSWQGREIVGLKLNFSKRYITLAPVATVIGLAFRMFDPEQLLGERTDIGITCALIPRDTPGVDIGRRHFPINIPFQNGPVHGHDVFVPLDCIIGGLAMAGSGWRMLVEQLSVGRCISLPANVTGGALAGVFATGAYARIRRQFNAPIGRFEGVQQAIARMVGYAYIMEAARSVTTAAIDQGEKPAVPAAILKYHLTEMGRRVANDAMDVQGGKAIMLGPRNYLARGYESIPIAITVEGANILTRNLIIFGQGAIRCHPYVRREMSAARDLDHRRGAREFDRALFEHIGFAFSNAVRSLLMAVSFARFESAPEAGATHRYYQHIVRFSASFALVTDIAMLTLGGYLKKKETISARLGDVLSMLYLASMVLKHHGNRGRPGEELPVVEWACRELLYQAQEQLHSVLRNLPNRPTAALARLLVFPRGLTYFAPADRLGRHVAELVTGPTATRAALARFIYHGAGGDNPLHALQQVLELAERAEPLEKKLRVEGLRTGRIRALDPLRQIEQARELGILTESEASFLADYDRRVQDIIAVDDFAAAELGFAEH
ncbi:MAG TPA: acyl-CoA dehydrogenase [Steroidobacteraceae bacterium]|nr:acyl-CoA dehydrogenase [Steroidobacteraceae bacterium]